MTPEQFLFGSHKKIWWKCGKGHEWAVAIASRTTAGHGCPFCSGRYASKDKNLSVEYPTLAKMWHPTKNEGLTPDNILAGSNSKVWWKCDNGLDHEWKAQPNSMQRSFKTGNSGCPFCRGLEVSVTNKLSILYPEVAKEWHPTKNGSLTPDNVTFGSGQKVWWKCRGMEEHIWQASISDRTVGGRGCPGCNLRGTSKIEIRLRFELRNFFEFDIYDNRLKTSEGNSYQVDIKVPSASLIIEYDGVYHHSSKKDVDARMTRSLQKDGWKVICIRTEELGSITDDDVVLTRRDADSAKVVMGHLLYKLALLGYLDTRVYDEYRKRDTLISNDKANEYINKLYSVDHKWDEMFDALIEYQNEFGNCKVPNAYVNSFGQRLGGWVDYQRQRLGELSPGKVQRLNEIEFVWHSLKQSWDEMFDALIEYKEKYGDCDVPQRHVSVSGQRLGNWVNTQRRFRKTKKLSPERVERLNEVGFVWASYRK